MADTPEPQVFNAPLFQQAWPGYLRTRLKLKRMKRLQDLIRHKERWAGDFDLAQPLEELLPGIPDDKRYLHIEPEINKCLPMVHYDLNRLLGIRTGVVYEEQMPFGNEPERNSYDLILDYHRLPRRGDGHVAFAAVMRVLDQGIGTLEARKKQAFYELFNPIVWASRVIRIPITIMERAGFGGHARTQELMIGGYATFMKIAMSLIVSLLVLLLGVKVPWGEIFTSIIRLILK
jgi:hypothetical protein